MLMLIVSDVYVLINYTRFEDSLVKSMSKCNNLSLISFVESAFIMFTVGGLLWLRWKKPDAPRPIKVDYAICNYL